MDADSDLVVAGASFPKVFPPLSNTQSVIAQRLQGVEPVDLTLTHELVSVIGTLTPPGSSTVIYKVRVSNLHPPVDLGVAPVVQSQIGAASEVLVETGYPFVSGSGTGWTCVQDYMVFGFSLRCSYGPRLAPGQTAQDLTVVQNFGIFFADNVTSAVRANQIDPNLSNNYLQTLVGVP